MDFRPSYVNGVSYLQTALSHGFNFSIAKSVSVTLEGCLEAIEFAKTQFVIDPWNISAISKKNLVVALVIETMPVILCVGLLWCSDVDSCCSKT